MDLQIIKQNLEKLEYEVNLFDNGKDCAYYLDKSIDNESVGFGGSVTLDQIGLYDLLNSHNDVYQHYHVLENTDTMALRKLENSANIYICSINAMSKDGIIINIDGIGNRLSSMLFGHSKVYLVVGRNKICEDVESAIYRARNIAAVKNAQRLNIKTPCAINGDHCYDCKSPQRICNAMLTFFRKPTHANIEILLVNEDLGY